MENKDNRAEEILKYLDTHIMILDEVKAKWRKNSLIELITIALMIFSAFMNLTLSWILFLTLLFIVSIRGRDMMDKINETRGRIKGALDILEILGLTDKGKPEVKKKKESKLEKIWAAIKRKKQKEAYVHVER